MPQNSNKSIFDLARIYGFYESSNGINVAGKIFGSGDLNYGSGKSFYAKEPVLTGDIIIDNKGNKVTMLNIVNIYNGAVVSPWGVTYIDGVLPSFKLDNQTIIEKPKYYESMLNSKKTIENEVVKLVETLVTQITLCLSTAPGLPITTLALLPTMELAIKDFKKAIYYKDDITGKEIGILVEEENNSFKL